MSWKARSKLDVAREKAEARAEAKASRALAAGIRLPQKRPRGWQLLREKLQEGVLLPSLRKLGAVDLSRKRSRVSLKDTALQARSMIPKATSSKSFVATSEASKAHMMKAKAEQELSRQRRAEREVRRKLIAKQKKLERELEYINFPTIMGWYFDGFFAPYFQLNEEWATTFNQMEIEISRNKESSIKETFAEKAKRYFWPPDIIAGLCFRTRGVYLDLEEIMKDPPHTPPDLVVDQRLEAVTLFMSKGKLGGSNVPSEEQILAELDQGPMTMAQIMAEENKLREKLKALDDDKSLTPEEKAMKKRFLLRDFKKKKDKAKQYIQSTKEAMKSMTAGKYDYYFDDQVPGFFKKRAKDRDQYYFDSQWDVWRKKRKIIGFPNDYYWDEQLALFFPKDRTRPPNYYLYDPALKVYRIGGEPQTRNWRNIKPSDFFFDYSEGKWIKKSRAPAGVTPTFDLNGMRFIANKVNDSPDDFYFDIQTQQFEEKKPDAKLYFYDPQFGAWRKEGTPLPEKGSVKPIAFYWNEKEHMFLKKDAPSSFFVWDQNNNFFRKKRSLHGKFHPKNWIWNEKTKMWDIKKTTAGHVFMSQSLNWRPDRDYDKPWLEYIGGYQDWYIDYDYDRYFDDETHDTGGMMGTTSTASMTIGRSDKKLISTTSEPAMKTGMAGMGMGVGPSGSEASKSNLKSDTETKSQEKDTFTFVDTMDRKTLKATNLGNLTDVDLRKYFGSVKKVIRPKVPGTERDEDYVYLKFPTEEAAAAALRTMHEQAIKEQKISLRYKLKVEDETKGGQRDVGAEKKEKSKKKKF